MYSNVLFVLHIIHFRFYYNIGEVMIFTTHSAHRTTFKYIIMSVTALFYYPYSYAVNQFSDTPLHLQSQSIQTTGYSVKPNITFFIDDSGSMDTIIKRQCYAHYRKKPLKISSKKLQLRQMNRKKALPLLHRLWVNLLPQSKIC